MRAAPAVTVTLGRSPHAVAALAALAAASTAASTVWAVQRDDAWGAVLVLLIGLHATWLARSVARRPSLCLRWDGERWWLGPAAEGEPWPGEVSVALDVGDWLLLRFRPEATAHARPRWLPVERAAVPADWHGLRCAVYSPRPAGLAGAASSS